MTNITIFATIEVIILTRTSEHIKNTKKRENQKECQAGLMLLIIEYDSIERNRREPIRENKANNFEGFSIFPFSSVCFKLRNL